MNDTPSLVPLIPVSQQSSHGTSFRDSPSMRSSPSLLRGPLVPSVPGIPTSPTTQRNISLRMPTIGTTRPVTTPVNIYRRPPVVATEVMIPPNITSRIGDSGASTTPSSVIRLPSTPAIRIPPPPVISSGAPSIQAINTAITAEIASSASLPTIPPPPLIKREEIVPIQSRPLSPRDTTEITIHDIPLDRSMIDLIPLDTDSEDEEDQEIPIKPGVTAEIKVPIPSIARAPTIVHTVIETTTADVIDDIIDEIANGPILAIPPDGELIRPASPTTQVDVPVIPNIPSLPPIAPDAGITHTLINPAPPTTSVSRASGGATIQPAIATRLPISRGRQPLPPTTQPTQRSTGPPTRPVPQTLAQPRQTPPTQAPPPLQPPPLRPLTTTRPSPPTQPPTQPVAQHSVQPTSQAPQPPIQSVAQHPVQHSIQPVAQYPVQLPPQPPPQSPLQSAQLPIREPKILPQPPGRTPAQVPVQLTQAPPAQITSTIVGIRQPVPRQSAPLDPSTIRRPDSFVGSGPSATTPRTPEPSRPTATDAILKGSNPTVVVPTPITDTTPLPVSAPTTALAPTLPAPSVPNYSAMPIEEQAQHRAHFRTRFGILRNAWPNYYIPDVPDNISLEQVHAQYDIYVRHIHISRDVDQYKVYLVIMWLLIELFCIKIGLNIGGYTVSQMRSMTKYERLLIELGETNYRSSSAEGAAQSNWPVEIRLFFMALVNAVTFIIIKMLANYIGENTATTIVEGISSYLSGAPPQPGQVLFGGPAQIAQPGSGPAPGGTPMPSMGGPFGGIDMASMLGNLGSMFLRSQGPLVGSAPQAAPAVAQVATSVPAAPNTPRYRPVYDE